MNIPQSQRWDKQYQQEAIALNFELIEKAIATGKELIILPGAFPLYLNQQPALLDELKNYSSYCYCHRLADLWKWEFFNSSYLFQEGEMQVANKIVLVPFGEEVPFPEFINTFVNKIFFDGAKDYQKAKAPQDFVIKGITFRNAICFEATKDLLFEGNPKAMIAISNNAWFTPSTEQTLQNLFAKIVC